MWYVLSLLLRNCMPVNEKRPSMKRDIHKRPMYMKTDLCIWIQTYKREDSFMWYVLSWLFWNCMPVNEKRPICMKRDVQKRPMYMKRDPEKRRPIYVIRIELTFEKLYACKWKETYVHEKRRTKETYVHKKRPVYMETDLEKRKLIHAIRIEPTCLKLYACKWKETYVHEKRRTEETYVHKKRPRTEKTHPCDTYQADFWEIVCL